MFVCNVCIFFYKTKRYKKKKQKFGTRSVVMDPKGVGFFFFIVF